MADDSDEGPAMLRNDGKRSEPSRDWQVEIEAIRSQIARAPDARKRAQLMAIGQNLVRGWIEFDLLVHRGSRPEKAETNDRHGKR